MKNNQKLQAFLYYLKHSIWILGMQVGINLVFLISLTFENNIVFIVCAVIVAALLGFLFAIYGMRMGEMGYKVSHKLSKKVLEDNFSNRAKSYCIFKSLFPLIPISFLTIIFFILQWALKNTVLRFFASITVLAPMLLLSGAGVLDMAAQSSFGIMFAASIPYFLIQCALLPIFYYIGMKKQKKIYLDIQHDLKELNN